MDTELYKAATKGEIAVFENLAEPLDCVLTPNGNTVLHVYLAAQGPKFKSSEFVEGLLTKCPPLLLQANTKNEIPLHFVATSGNAFAVKFLIRCAKAQKRNLEGVEEAARQMLRLTDNGNNTALHKAAQYGQLSVVKVLLEEEDPDFPCFANNDGETPLYIAARRGYHELVDVILDKCPCAAYGGPDDRTALHAAVMARSTETIESLLKKKKMLTKEGDKEGRTPLHFAAHFGSKYYSIVEQLLECDRSAAYIADKKRKMTVLHMAARQGDEAIMRLIITRCPDCCELVDNQGWNFFHFANATLRMNQIFRFVQFLKMEYPLALSLLAEKDNQGNTPMQVLRASFPLGIWLGRGIQDERLTTEKKAHIHGLLEDAKLDNVAGVEVFGMDDFTHNLDAVIEKGKEYYLIVATLIATVAFSAGLNVPGSYKNSDEGTAALIGNAAFVAFVIADACAMVFSITAVFIHFFNIWYRWRLLFTARIAIGCTGLAIVAMQIAFITGLYAVLTPSRWLAATACIIGSTFFIFMYLVMRWASRFVGYFMVIRGFYLGI